jgi:hypothetical protein
MSIDIPHNDEMSPKLSLHEIRGKAPNPDQRISSRDCSVVFPPFSGHTDEHGGHTDKAITLGQTG